jgi:hypothetical protein
MKVTRFKLLFPQSIFSIFEYIEISLLPESESHHCIKLWILKAAGRKVLAQKMPRYKSWLPISHGFSEMKEIGNRTRTKCRTLSGRTVPNTSLSFFSIRSPFGFPLFELNRSWIRICDLLDEMDPVPWSEFGHDYKKCVLKFFASDIFSNNNDNETLWELKIFPGRMEASYWLQNEEK